MPQGPKADSLPPDVERLIVSEVLRQIGNGVQAAGCRLAEVSKAWRSYVEDEGLEIVIDVKPTAYQLKQLAATKLPLRSITLRACGPDWDQWVLAAAAAIARNTSLPRTLCSLTDLVTHERAAPLDLRAFSRLESLSFTSFSNTAFTGKLAGFPGQLQHLTLSVHGRPSSDFVTKCLSSLANLSQLRTLSLSVMFGVQTWGRGRDGLQSLLPTLQHLSISSAVLAVQKLHPSMFCGQRDFALTLAARHAVFVDTDLLQSAGLGQLILQAPHIGIGYDDAAATDTASALVDGSPEGAVQGNVRKLLHALRRARALQTIIMRFWAAAALEIWIGPESKMGRFRNEGLVPVSCLHDALKGIGWDFESQTAGDFVSYVFHRASPGSA